MFRQPSVKIGVRVWSRFPEGESHVFEDLLKMVPSNGNHLKILIVKFELTIKQSAKSVSGPHGTACLLILPIGLNQSCYFGCYLSRKILECYKMSRKL